MTKDNEATEAAKARSNALYADHRTAAIVKSDRRTPARATARQVAAGTYRPRGVEDLPWRIKYRTLRAMFRVFGPPTLGPNNDPLARLARDREARYAGRKPRS